MLKLFFVSLKGIKLIIRERIITIIKPLTAPIAAPKSLSIKTRGVLWMIFDKIEKQMLIAKKYTRKLTTYFIPPISNPNGKYIARIKEIIKPPISEISMIKPFIVPHKQKPKITMRDIKSNKFILIYLKMVLRRD